jgi:hypothetical protein
LAWLDRWSKRIELAAVGLVSLVAGLLAIHERGRIRFSDEADYLAIANNLVHGHGYSINGHQPTAYRSPGLPLLLAPFRLIGMPVTGLRLINVALLAGTCWMAWTLANHMAGRAAGALAAAATAAYPLQIFTASTFYPETLATTLLLGGVLSMVKADGERDPRSARRLVATSGLAFAGLTLTVPQLGVAAIVCLGWFAWRHRGGAVQALLTVALALFILPLAIWTGRNAVQMHAFVPATTGSGYNLLIGNSEHTTYGSGVNTDISRYEEVAAAQGLNEVGRNRYFQNAAIGYIEHHPARSLAMWAEKTLNYFIAANKLSTGSQSSRLRDIVASLTYYPLLLLLVCRLIRWRQVQVAPAEWLLVVIYLVMAPAMGVFVTRVRYRVPLDELLLILIAVGLARMAASNVGGGRTPLTWLTGHRAGRQPRAARHRI